MSNGAARIAKSFAASLARFLPLLALLDDVRVAGLDCGASLSWHLPSDVIPGATEIYGVPVVRYGGPPALALCPHPVTVGHPSYSHPGPQPPPERTNST